MVFCSPGSGFGAGCVFYTGFSHLGRPNVCLMQVKLHSRWLASLLAPAGVSYAGLAWLGLALALLCLALLCLAWLGFALLCWAWLCLAWLCFALLAFALLGLAWLGFAWHCFAWLCLALLGFAWLGFAWLGFAWLCLAWLGCASPAQPSQESEKPLVLLHLGAKRVQKGVFCCVWRQKNAKTLIKAVFFLTCLLYKLRF